MFMPKMGDNPPKEFKGDNHLLNGMLPPPEDYNMKGLAIIAYLAFDYVGGTMLFPLG